MSPFSSNGITLRLAAVILRPGGCWLRVFVATILAGGGVALPFATAAGEAAVTKHVSAAPATSPEPKSALDELVYRDGDRVRGHFVERTGGMVVFRSERFGIVRAPADEVEVILAMPLPSAPPPMVDQAGSEPAVERAPFSPLAMAQTLKKFFGPWHGRLSLGAEVLNDVNDRNSTTVEAHLERKWRSDEVKINGRFDYAAVNETVATDVVKADAEWRHDFAGRFFAVYRPALEWNRAFYRTGQPADYVLLQQEAGAGINLMRAETRRLRLGAAENIFDTWVTPAGARSSQTIESFFAEFETKLPWRITLTNRGVWYHSFSDQSDGWENRFEVSKKLTETLTIGAQHEARQNNPVVRSADYQRHRVLLGLDF